MLMAKCWPSGPLIKFNSTGKMFLSPIWFFTTFLLVTTSICLASSSPTENAGNFDSGSSLEERLNELKNVVLDMKEKFECKIQDIESRFTEIGYRKG